MSAPAATIMTDRQCDHCGYNLKGLAEGSKCPECGAPARRLGVRTSGMMTDEAPTRFIKKLRLGFTLASIAILASIVLRFVHLGLIASGFWVAGIWLITSARPGVGHIRPDKVLDNEHMRSIIRYASFAWPVYSLSSLGQGLMIAPGGGGATGPGLLLGVLSVITMLTGITAWFSLIPTSVYFAEISYWASHNNLSDRLRATAWSLAVFGTIGAILTAMAVLAGSTAAIFVGIIIWLIIALTLVIFGLTTIQLRAVMSWVIRHQVLAAGSPERIRKRMERETMRPGHIATELFCHRCGYDLLGLPFGGDCPECGESYADFTPMPVRDPAKMPSYHDNSELELEKGEGRGVYFNDQLDASGKPKAGDVPYTPQIEVPDEGDIPLSMDDEAQAPPEDREDQHRDS